LIYIIKESDPRLASSLWELYILLKQLPVDNKTIPVCVVILKDNNIKDGKKDSGDDIYNKIAGLSVKEALPPKREKWFSKEYHNYVDKLWEQDLLWIETHNRTSSHGMQLPIESDSPELSEIHRGSWTIMVMNSMKNYCP